MSSGFVVWVYPMGEPIAIGLHIAVDWLNAKRKLLVFLLLFSTNNLGCGTIEGFDSITFSTTRKKLANAKKAWNIPSGAQQ